MKIYENNEKPSIYTTFNVFVQIRNMYSFVISDLYPFWVSRTCNQLS